MTWKEARIVPECCRLESDGVRVDRVGSGTQGASAEASDSGNSSLGGRRSWIRTCGSRWYILGFEVGCLRCGGFVGKSGVLAGDDLD